jgi:glycosyltransferase involved in cell wall biosynthesis
MKTILHTIDTTGPGGAETVFIDLIAGIPATRYRSIVVIRGEGWVCDEVRRRGFEPLFMDNKGSFNLRYLTRLVSLVRREKVDLIQSHLLGSNVYCSLAGLVTGRPVVATFHGAVDIGKKNKLSGTKYRAINAGAAHVIAVSEQLRGDLLARTSIRPGKIRVIYNGIRTADYQRPHSNELRDRFGWSEDEIIIGSLGNIRPAKGYDILLRAVAMLKQEHASLRFVIAGQGKDGLYDELLLLRERLGLQEQVRFLGFCDDAAGFLAGLDMFLSSSISEGLPLSAIQAMVAELPVIATHCGGYEELVTHGENGWLVEAGNPRAIAEGVALLAGDKDLRMKLASNARLHAVGKYDIKAMLEAYEGIYDRLGADGLPANR